MKYHQITVHTVTEAVEAISYTFTEMGAGGVEIFDPKDILNQEKEPTSWDYIDEDLLKDLKKDEVLMRCYFSTEIVPTPAALEDLLFRLKASIDEIAAFLPVGSGQIDTKLMAEEEWANAWKKYYQPFHLGHHIFVVPSWVEAQDEPGDIRISLDPGMAFGTGNHATTALCINLLEDYVQKGMKILDVGTGSGILAIQAALLGADNVEAMDYDTVAVQAAKENIALNQLISKVSIVRSDLLQEAREAGDIIVANIVADIIIRLTPETIRYLKGPKLFISSGIIDTRKDDVLKTLAQFNFKIMEIRESAGWVAIVASYGG